MLHRATIELNLVKVYCCLFCLAKYLLFYFIFLQTLVQASGKKFSTEDRVVDVAEAIKQIKTPLGFGAKFALKKIVPRARQSVGK